MAGAKHSPDLSPVFYFIPSSQIRRSRPPALTRDPSPMPRVSGGRRLGRRCNTGDLGWSSPSPTTASRASMIPAAAASSVTAAMTLLRGERPLARPRAAAGSVDRYGSADALDVDRGEEDGPHEGVVRTEEVGAICSSHCSRPTKMARTDV